MKNATLIIALFASLLFASCKKNYVCECKTDSGVVSDSYPIKNTPKKAKQQCDDYHKAKNSGLEAANYIALTCSLK